MISNTVEKSFTRYAGTYDEFSGVQKETARRLIELTRLPRAPHILEIGCGTGNYTALLAQRYPAGRITAIDISEAMIRRAREKVRGAGIEFAVMDAGDLTGGKRYDIITSNACFHWLADVDAMMSRCASMLREDGMLTASIFGPRTLHELIASLHRAGKRVPARARGFLLYDVLRGMGQRHFKRWEISEAAYSRQFDSLVDLLRVIKYSGVRGDIEAPGFLFTPDLIRKIEADYKREYGSIIATFQVFFCKGFR